MKNNKPGYILIFTLVIMGLSSALVTYIYNKGTIFTAYGKLVQDRDHAKQLAFGGLHIAIAKLTAQPKQEPKTPQPPADSQGGTKQPADPGKEFLKQILPSLNRFEQTVLTYDKDGIDATIQFCIVCEEGKININALYDFEKHTFKGEKDDKNTNKKILQTIFEKIEKITKAKDLFKALENFLKEQQFPLNDITQLLTIKEFGSLQNVIYYEPPQAKTETRSIYFADTFTTHTSSATLQPWLLSDSVSGLLDLNRAQADDQEQRKKTVAEVTKNFKKSSQWKQDWNSTLKPLYGKELQNLPQDIDLIFNDTFAPQVFSILVEVTVANAVQRLWVVGTLTKMNNKKDRPTFVIKRMYWL
jgi:hypothetical protein